MRVPGLMYGGQRTALWLLFYSATFFWVPGTELRSPDLLGKRFYLLNHLVIPVSFLFKTVQKSLFTLVRHVKIFVFFMVILYVREVSVKMVPMGKAEEQCSRLCPSTVGSGN